MGVIRLLFQNRSLILMCFLIYILLWIYLATLHKSTRIDRAVPFKMFQHRTNSSFFVIFDYLVKNKIQPILIDPDILNQLFLQHFSLNAINKRWITFGLIDQPEVTFLSATLINNISIELSQSEHDGKILIDHIFIHHQEQIVHLAILHRKNFYYFINENDYPLPEDVQLSFGDTMRAIELYELDYLDDEHDFFYPRNISHFLWLYDKSKFISCDRTLADQMEKKFNLSQKTSQWNLTVDPMRNIVGILNNLEKNYWLAGGTLLGWYRHCGLIPFTQDVDFGLFAEEYDESIRNRFLGDRTTYLWGALGLINDSLEFRLYTGRFTFDLFWAYREKDHRWCGYQVHRIKFRRTLPLLEELCSGDLFGYLFTIPCSPVEYLDAEYGIDMWKNPLEKNYTWINMKYHSYWDDISWMYAVRLYTRQGKLRTDKYAINWISDHFNYSITKIPSFLNAIPSEPVTLPPLKKKLVYVSSPKKYRSASRKRTSKS